MASPDSQSPAPPLPPTLLEAGRQMSDPPSEAGTNSHIQLEIPQRPDLYPRKSLRGQSSKSVSEALRLERSREEQETLLGADEEADDDGCYPPRNHQDGPRAPNPHKSLPIYATIHKIRRLVIASIGGRVVLQQSKARLRIA